MKQISTGAGLVALSVGMVATAFIASHRSGGEAFAQGTGALATMASATPDCEIRVESWFDPTPRPVAGCSFFGWNPTKMFTSQPVDHLGDGVARPTIYGTTYDGDDGTPDFDFVDVLGFQFDSAGTATISRIRVLTLPVGGLGAGFEMDGGGWIDMDSDGDLDLLMRSQATYVWSWYENIAGSSTSANPYDLDHDGYVGTADLSLLLMQFTD